MIRKLTFRKSFTGFKVSILREKQFKKFRTVSYYWKTPPRHRLLLFVYLSASELLLSLNCGADFCNPIPEAKRVWSVTHTGLSQVGPKSQEFQQSLGKSHLLLVLHSTGQISSVPQPCIAPFLMFTILQGFCLQQYQNRDAGK